MNNIHKKTIENFIKMAKINSPSGHEERFADFCVKQLKKLNFLIIRDGYNNIIARNQNNIKSRPFLLSAHLDTVGLTQNIRPFIKNKRIITTDGSTILGADNKLTIAIYFGVIESLMLNKVPIRPLEIVLTTKEELGMAGARKLDFPLISAREGISVDSEGEVGCFSASSPYAETFEIKIIGRAAHAAFPEKGIDAIKIFSETYSILKTGRISKNTTLNFGLINGGEGGNIVAEKVICSGNLRSQYESELKIQKKIIENIFKNTARKYKGRVEIQFTKIIQGYNYVSDLPMINRLNLAVAQRLRPKSTNMGSDANIFIEHGIQVVNLCSGVKNTHTNKERVSVKNILKLFNLIEKIIKNYKAT